MDLIVENQILSYLEQYSTGEFDGKKKVPLWSRSILPFFPLWSPVYM